jgi:predicted HTH domain antitoxin
MTQIVMNFEPGAFSALRLGPKEFGEELKLAAVVQWYAEQRISQSKAAEILGMSRSSFLDELFRRKVPGIQVTADELEQEIHGDL